MKTHVKNFALVAAIVVATLPACNEVGSCTFATEEGYNYCVDFLGSEYTQNVTQNTCSNGSGSWSADSCSSGGALGTCAIAIGDGHSQNVMHTYYPSSGSGSDATTTLHAETACGVAGGTFTPTE